MSKFHEGDIIRAVVKDGDIVFEKGVKPESDEATDAGSEPLPPAEEPALT